MSRQAIILAGGLGTRLRTAIGNVPKALAEVGGVPVLGHQLALCAHCGFDDVLLLLGHAAETVKAYVGDGSYFGVRCRFVIEEQPLGTAGATLAAREWLQPRFLVMYCDTMLDVDLDRFWRFTEAHDDAAVAILVHPNDHPFDSDLVATDMQDRITGFSRWRDDPIPPRNLASAALYIMQRRALEGVKPRDGVLDFGRHIFPELVADGKILIAYRSVEYIKDLGTPERLIEVNCDLATGKVDPLRWGRPRSAVFLDRDGVLNVERNGVLEPGQMELLPGAAEGLRLLNKAGLATVVITNQPYISFGRLSEAGLDAIHAVMERDLAREHAFVDAIHHCPHHTEKGHAGERAELKFDCACRKPKPGMILHAAKDLNLDLGNSWMVGDRTTDVAAAKAAGLRAVLVRGGHGGKDGITDTEPDFIFEDLREAARFITKDFPVLRAFCEEFVQHSVRPGTQILIGGQARSGKSTAASALAEAVRALGLETVVLPLDCWLKDLVDRGSGVLERYHLNTVATTLAKLRCADRAIKISIPAYDRHMRQKIGDRTRIVSPDAIVICEGVAALALKAPGALRLAVRVDEYTRRERFDAFYRWRGEEAHAARYWQDRQVDEVPMLDALLGSAVMFPEFGTTKP